jgi:hypothetical protein
MKVALKAVRVVDAKEGVAVLLKHLDTDPRCAPHVASWTRGDVVKVNDQWLGMIVQPDGEDEPASFIYLDEQGVIQGPMFGYDCEKLELGK